MRTNKSIQKEIHKQTAIRTPEYPESAGQVWVLEAKKKLKFHIKLVLPTSSLLIISLNSLCILDTAILVISNGFKISYNPDFFGVPSNFLQSFLSQEILSHWIMGSNHRKPNGWPELLPITWESTYGDRT